MATASLGTITGASPVNTSNNTYITFATDSNGAVLTNALGNTDVFFETMVGDLTYTIEYSLQNTPDNDQYGLGVRIVNGGTILAAADAGGGFHPSGSGNINSMYQVTSTTDTTQSNVSFPYVNTTANKTLWDGATIEFEQGYNKSQSGDGNGIRIDFFSVTGTYNVADQTATPTGIASQEALGSVSVTSIVTATNAGNIASQETFGTAYAALGRFIQNVGNIATEEALGSPSVNIVALPTGIASQETIGGVSSVDGFLTVGSIGNIASQEAFGTATAQMFVSNISGIASQEAFGSSQVNITVHPNGFVDGGEDFGSFTTHRFIPADGSGIASQEAFGTFTSNIFVHNPPSIVTQEAFGSPSVNIVAFPSGITTQEAFGDLLGHQTLPIGSNGIASQETFGTPTSNVFIQNPPSIETQEAVGSPQANIIVRPSGWDDSDGFGNATVNMFVSGAGNIASEEAFGTPSYVLYVNGTLVEDPDVFFGYGYANPPSYYINMPPDTGGYFVQT